MESPARERTKGERAAKWLRRAVTIPGLLVLWLVDLAALPFVLLVALVLDVARRRPLPSARFHLAVAFTLSAHVVALVRLLGGWLAGGLAGTESETRADVRTEAWFAKATWRAAIRLYGMRVVVDGDDAIGGAGPLVVMSRHASLIDVLLPIVYVFARQGFAPRYVAKRELLWDPCIDLVGHRLAMAFVRREGREHDLDVAAVASLANDLGPRDAVIIFPEGTRFTEAKRARAIAALAKKDEATSARAARLRHVLPPHMGGPLAVLERARGADVVFSAHTGLEGANHLRDLVAGSLIGATIRVRYWRVPARDVPADAAARVEWLWQWWERIDAWIEESRAPSLLRAEEHREVRRDEVARLGEELAARRLRRVDHLDHRDA